MLPIRGKRALAFRLAAIPTAALLASHFIAYQRFPWQPAYRFPTVYFLMISTLIIACWEVNLEVFRRLDRTMPFHRNPLRRIGWQVGVGGLFTALTFGVVFSLIALIGYGHFPSPTSFIYGLFICFGIAGIINAVYVGLYLVDVIYWQKSQTAGQLNRQLANQQTEVVTLAESESGPRVTAETVTRMKPAPTGILIEMGNQTQQLRPDEIAYFYSSGGIVQLIRTDGRKLTTSYDALTALSDRLSPAQFFQINRQYVVNLNAVRAVRDDVNRKLTITLIPALSTGQCEERVTISRYRSGEFQRWLSRAATA